MERTLSFIHIVMDCEDPTIELAGRVLTFYFRKETASCNSANRLKRKDCDLGACDWLSRLYKAGL